MSADAVIILKGKLGSDIRVVVSQIAVYLRESGEKFTTVWLTGDLNIKVKNTPEEIDQIIQEAWDK